MPLKDSNTAPAASLPDASAETRLALTAALLFNALRGLLVLLLLGLGILIPFLAVNKTGASVVLLSVALFMLVIPNVLLRQGKIMPAAWSFSVSGTVISTVLLIFSGGLRSPAIAYQLAIAVVAIILIGRRAAFLCGAAALAVDLVVAIADRAGFHPPILFPFRPINWWFNLMLSGVLTLPLVYQAMVWLTSALDNSRKQIERQKKDQEVLSYQAQLIAQAAEPVVATDINGVMTYWNAAAERVFGWPQAEALGRNTDELLRFAPGAATKDQISEHLAREGRWIGEIHFLNRVGNRVIVEAAMTVLLDSSIELLTSHPGPIDLLITDVVMPGMTGRDLADKLAGTHNNLKVLYISGYAANLTAHKGDIGTGLAFLHKPFTLSTPAVKVRELLGAEQPAGETPDR